MQHNDSYTENTYGFVNNITTPEGGTHVMGFRNALTKTFNDYARKNKLLKDNEQNLSGEDIREGLTAIISVKIEEPQFEDKAEAGKQRGQRSSGQYREQSADTVSGAESIRGKNYSGKIYSGTKSQRRRQKSKRSNQKKDGFGGNVSSWKTGGLFR